MRWRVAGVWTRAGAWAGLAIAWSAPGQLSPRQVLVVYDSRVPDSLAVAEYYAGAANVPGGVGSPGKRPLVRVFDLASSGAPVAAPGNITHADYAARLRNPIRSHLTGTGLAGVVRCVVLTKGLPHRIFDTDNAVVGDNPAFVPGELTANDITYASVDSELTLLWQDFDAGEAGGSSDSKLDGGVFNPFWRSAQSIIASPNGNIGVPKPLVVLDATGPLWQSNAAAAIPQRLTAGDIVLTARLDGPSVAEVQASLDRAQGFVYGATTHGLLFESDTSGFDTCGTGLWLAACNGVDYTLASNALIADGRFRSTSTPTVPAPGVNVNAANGPQNFYIGPRIQFFPGQGVLVNFPVAYYGSYGSNHATGVPTLAPAGTSSALVYATSFHFAPGAIFNTLESFNGRDFGGLGHNASVPQQQVSTYLTAGGTFAIGNVWEPFAAPVPDNEFLIKNFVLGGMTWAEAAWSSVPALSWQQVVIGDPLARAVRSTDDLTGNAAFDVGDAHEFEQLGVADPRRDINRDGAINAADRTLLLRSLRLTERAAMLADRP